MNDIKNLGHAYFICALSALFYCYEFFLQVSPGVMTHELMRDYQLDAAGLGIVAASYYYAYMPMQMVAGLLYDRLGPRTLLTVAASVCAVGALLFSLSHLAWLAAIGRFLMGGGSAFAFLGTLVLIARWCPTSQFALLVGLTQLLGSTGAIFAETPLSLSVAQFGWRGTIIVIALAGFVLAAILASFIRNRPTEQARPKSGRLGRSEWRNFKKILRNQQIRWIACYSFLVWAPMPIFAALWGVPYLMTLYHKTEAQAASLCIAAWVGVALSSPFMGWCSDRIQLRRLLISFCALVGIISTLIMLYFAALPSVFMLLLIFGLGVAASGQSLCFALAKDNIYPHQVGAAFGFVNMCVVAGGALFQPLVGALLKLSWDGTLVQGVPKYLLSDYRGALLMMPICYTIAWLISILKIEETKCQPQWQTN